MIVLKFTYPLQWPQHSERTSNWDKKINQTFKVGLTIQEALTFLQEELDLLGAKQAIVNTDYENLPNPRLQRKVGQEVAACVQFKINDYVYHVACDQWLLVEQNIYTIHLMLRNIRTTIDLGIGSINQFLMGFSTRRSAEVTANPHLPFGERRARTSPAAIVTPQVEEWRLALGLGPSATLEDAHATYRRRAKSAGNDQEALLQLNLAMDAATKALGI